MSTPFLFTSESVTEGHPDKAADQISDAILDRLLEKDPNSKVAVETLITDNFCVLAGEVASTAHIDYVEVAKKTLHNIGYGTLESGFDLSQAEFVTRIHEQSLDIQQGVVGDNPGAGDQGVMFGYAVNETPELMPLTLMLARRLTQGLKKLRETTPWLLPDGKSQVTLLYDAKGKPVDIKNVLLSAQHKLQVSSKEVEDTLKKLIFETIESSGFESNPTILINPTGRFVKGGPAADTGLTGRKLIVDTYGGRAHHGGGAFSGKDATKVDRSGAYAARYIAKNIVAAGITPECEVMLAYAIGVADPISLRINTFGHYKNERALEEKVLKSFPVTPRAIIEAFDLKRPIFQEVGARGHFGRTVVEEHAAGKSFLWERLDRLSIF